MSVYKIEDYHIKNDYRLNHYAYNENNNTKNKIYFFPTGKTGGCFIRSYLNFELKFWDPYQYNNNQENIDNIINPLLNNNICIISYRNPIDKLISSFLMIISGGLDHYIKKINQEKKYYQIIWENFSKINIQNILINNFLNENKEIYQKYNWEKYIKQNNINHDFYSNNIINGFIHYLLIGKNNIFKIFLIENKENYNQLKKIEFSNEEIQIIAKTGFFSKYNERQLNNIYFDTITDDNWYMSFNLFLDLLINNDKYDGHIWNQTEILRILYGIDYNNILKIKHIIFTEELNESCNLLAEKYDIKINKIDKINEGNYNIKKKIQSFLKSELIQNKLKIILKDDILMYDILIHKFNKQYLMKYNDLYNNFINFYKHENS